MEIKIQYVPAMPLGLRMLKSVPISPTEQWIIKGIERHLIAKASVALQIPIIEYMTDTESLIAVIEVALKQAAEFWTCYEFRELLVLIGDPIIEIETDQVIRYQVQLGLAGRLK